MKPTRNTLLSTFMVLVLLGAGCAGSRNSRPSNSTPQASVEEIEENTDAPDEGESELTISSASVASTPTRTVLPTIGVELSLPTGWAQSDEPPPAGASPMVRFFASASSDDELTIVAFPLTEPDIRSAATQPKQFAAAFVKRLAPDAQSRPTVRSARIIRSGTPARRWLRMDVGDKHHRGGYLLAIDPPHVLVNGTTTNARWANFDRTVLTPMARSLRPRAERSRTETMGGWTVTLPGRWDIQSSDDGATVILGPRDRTDVTILLFRDPVPSESRGDIMSLGYAQQATFDRVFRKLLEKEVPASIKNTTVRKDRVLGKRAIRVDGDIDIPATVQDMAPTRYTFYMQTEAPFAQLVVTVPARGAAAANRTYITPILHTLRFTEAE